MSSKPNEERMYLSPSVHVMRRDSQIGAINTANGEWIKLAGPAGTILEEVIACDRLEEIVGRAVSKLGIDESQVRGVLDVLEEREIVTPVPPKADPDEVDAVSPSRALVEVIHECNLGCAMCYISAAKPLDLSGQQPTAEEVITIFDRLVEAGVSRVYVLGGEPLLREDIFDLLDVARRRFELVHIATNGTLVSQEAAERLVKLVDVVHVGLDGSTPEINAATRSHAAFHAAIQGIRHLVEAGHSRVLIDRVLHEGNAEDSEAMQALGDRLGVERVGTCWFMPAGRGHQSNLSISPATSLRLFASTVKKRVEELREAGSVAKKGHWGILNTALSYAGTRCGALSNKVSIGYDGAIYPCQYLHVPELALGNILVERNWLEVVREAPVTRQILSRKVDAIPACANCDVRYFCGGGCMAQAYWANGDLFTKDPLCAIFRTVREAELWSFDGNRSQLENTEALLRALGLA